MSVIGLDIGTTRIKALFDDGTSAEPIVAATTTPVIASAHGDLRDAEAVVQATMSCIAELCAAMSPEQRRAVQGMSVASLSEEVVLLDGRARTIAPLPAWYTTVAADASARARLNPSYSWSKLHWAHASLPESSRAEVRGVTTLGSYVAARLANDAIAAIDYSHASRTGFFHVDTGRWDENTFEATGWSRDLLPPLVRAGTALGELGDHLAHDLGLPIVPVAVAGHDHFCGAFAAGIRQPRQLFVSAGTSEAHVLILDRYPSGELPSDVQVGRFVDGSSYYLHAHLPSGHLHAHLESLAGGQSRLTELANQALREPIGAGGLEFIPNVGADPGYSVRGLSARASNGAFIRAVHEGLALAARDLDDQLDDVAGTAATALVATGVATRDLLWLTIRAALSTSPLGVVDEPELTALGAAQVFRAAVLGETPLAVPHHTVTANPEEVTAYNALRTRRHGSHGDEGEQP